MKRLDETTLPSDTVAALSKLGIKTVPGLLNCTGQFMQSKLPGHYHTISQWVQENPLGVPRSKLKKRKKQVKLTYDQAQLVRKLYGKGVAQKDIAKELGVTPGCVNRIVNNKTFVLDADRER